MDNIFYTNIVLFLSFLVGISLMGYTPEVTAWIKRDKSPYVPPFVLWILLSVLSVPAFVIYKIWSA